MALSEAQINGRFHFLERPAALPGKCACCGAVDKPVIDFGFDLDFYGVVYLCVECLGEAFTIMRDNFASAAPQTVPLPSINVEAINAYVLDATDAINRLLPLLPVPVDAIPDVEVSEAAVGEPEPVIPDAQGNDDAQHELVSIGGPDDVSGSDRSDAFNF